MHHTTPSRSPHNALHSPSYYKPQEVDQSIINRGVRWELSGNRVRSLPADRAELSIVTKQLVSHGQLVLFLANHLNNNENVPSL